MTAERVATPQSALRPKPTSLWMAPRVAAYVIPKLLAVQVPFRVDYSLAGAVIIYVLDKHALTVATAREQVEQAQASRPDRRDPLS